MVVREKLDKIRKGELSAFQNITNLLNRINDKNKEWNIFLYVNPNVLEEAKKVDEKIKNGKAGKLAGLGIGLKANINVVGMPVSCSSKTLEDYYGTFDADVVEKIKKEDGIILGVLNCDEFACGSSGEYSAFGCCANPAAIGHIPGGSSSGAGAAVAAGMADITLGSDTGGSIRNPASHCGVVGVKPSYGRVSRYGLIDLSMSLDQIGPLSSDVFGCALMMEVISGYSDYDPVTFEKPVGKYTDFKTPRKIRIGVSKEFMNICTDSRIIDLVNHSIQNLSSELEASQVNIELKYINLAIQTYYPLVYVEFYSGTRKLDGRRYGKKIEDSCGKEVLLRILGGEEISKSEYEGKYYRKALEVMHLVKNDFENAFKKCDVIISPVVPSLPHKIGQEISDPTMMYAYDALTIPANLAGICAASVPCGKIDNIPVGIQVMCPAFKEDVMFNVMKTIEGIGK